MGRKPRKRGGKASKRGLSSEQVPVLMAADRSGTTFSAVLPAVTVDALVATLKPVLEPDVPSGVRWLHQLSTLRRRPENQP